MDEVEVPPTNGQWRSRPVIALALRTLVFAIPIFLTVGASLVAGALLRPLRVLAGTLVWWEVMVLISVAVLVLTMRLCRRALPLAALFKLSLPFPDAPPSRITLARGTSTRKLRRRLQDTSEGISLDDNVGYRSGRQAVERYERGRRAQDILTLVATLSVHDRAMRAHSDRVGMFADMIAAEMAFSAADRDRLRWAAMLHDIGKIKVAGEVLNNPGRLDEDQWQLLRGHAEVGAKMLEPLAPWLGHWVHAAEHHHERWDGSGYPHGLAGEEISIAGRIVAVADAYEAMTAARAYKRPKSVRAAREELVRGAGAQFDPAVVRAFLSIPIRRLRRVVGLGALFAQVPLAGPLVSPSMSGSTGLTVATAGVAFAALGVVGGLAPALAPRQQVEAATPNAGNPTPGSASQGSATPTETVSPSAEPPQKAPAPVESVAGTSTVAGRSGGGGGTAAAPAEQQDHPAGPPDTTMPGASGFTYGRAGMPIPGQGGTPPGHAK
jgi:putative nucleotidyltransferase with HDIG domain